MQIKKSLSKIGCKNPQWKGDKVGYKALHEWVRNHYSKPLLCDCCKSRMPYDLANVSDKYNSETYNRDLVNWIWLCRSCHMKKDSRAKKISKIGKKQLAKISKERIGTWPSKEKHLLAFEYYKSGLTMKQAGKLVGLSTAGVDSAFRKHNLDYKKYKKNKWTKIKTQIESCQKIEKSYEELLESKK